MKSINSGARLRLRTVHAAAVFAILTASVASAQVKVSVGDVKDTRRTDGFFNKLEVDLKISGESLSGAKGIRALVSKGIDETGKNLINEKESENNFKEIDSSDKETKLSIELKNPERRASAVQEIS